MAEVLKPIKTIHTPSNPDLYEHHQTTLNYRGLQVIHGNYKIFDDVDSMVGIVSKNSVF